MPEQMLGLGFGFVEVGTHHAASRSAGNPKPRLFRLVEDRAVINRMGFNNRRAGRPRSSGCGATTHLHGVIGVNVGANKDSADRIADYVAGRADNGAGRALPDDQHQLAQHAGAARAAGRRRAARACSRRSTKSRPDKPIFLKVAPDLEPGDHERIVRAALDHHVDALIVANTTVSRPPLKSRHAEEAGGLSGEPLKPLALDALRAFRSASGGEIPLIAVGGIANADDAWERIRGRREPGPALFGDGLRGARHRPAHRRGPGRAAGARRLLPTSPKRSAAPPRAASARSAPRLRGAGRTPPSIRPSRISTPWTPESSPWPGLRSIPRRAKAVENLRRELGHLALEVGPARDEVGRGERLLHRQVPVDRARPATWRHRRGSHCRRPSRSRRRSGRRGSSRIVGVIDERGRLPGATALAAGRPSVVDRLEREIGHLVVEEEAVDHPARCRRSIRPWWSSTRHCRRHRGR